MKYVLSNYNFDPSWVTEYSDDYVIYDRSDSPTYVQSIEPDKIIQVPNIGSDIYDKFTFIIDNYDNLPDVAVYSKSNLFKYMTKEEFELIKDVTAFTPLLTQHHKEVLCDYGMPEPGTPFSFYKDKIYYELNYPAYLKSHKTQDPHWCYVDTFPDFPLVKLLGIDGMKYVPFAPGSNYILPKENILKHPKEFYEELRAYLAWDRYPGEAMVIERGLYTLWK